MKARFQNKITNLYSFLNNEEDARVCNEIPEEAYNVVPGNFFLITLSSTMTKLGDALSNPKTVLAWLMSYVNAPVSMITFLVPIRESGSMLPQLLIASSVSAPFWGKWQNVSSKNVMIKGALITSILGVLFFIMITWIPFLKDISWLYPVAFFILGIAHSGVRLGRKTYIIDMAGGNKRTDYVAVSNTVIGFVLLITGGISALASFLSPQGIILILSIFGLFGALASNQLPKVT